MPTVAELQEQREPLPFDGGIEQSILGALLVDNATYESVSDFLRPEHFYVTAHGRIFDAIAKTLTGGAPCTPSLLRQAFKNDEELNLVGGAAYLADLAGSVVTILNTRHYARHIVDLHQRRELIRICDEAKQAARIIEPEVRASSMIETLEGGLYTIAEGGVTQRRAQSFTQTMGQVLDAAGRAYKRDPSARGKTTGLTDLDKLLGGLSPSDLIILGGRPGMGKSALSGDIAAAVARSGETVGFFSLEMSAEQLGMRFVSQHSGICTDMIRRGELSHGQFVSVVETTQAISELPLRIDDSAGQTIATMRTEARRIKRRHGLGLIVVDYIQMIRSDAKDRRQNRVEELGQITLGLKNIAKELDVPVLALSQLSRAVEQRDDKRPQLADLRESGTIEQDADVVMFVFREEYYASRDEPIRKADEGDERFRERFELWERRRTSVAGLAELLVEKNRHGPCGVVKLRFDGPTTTFSDLTARYSVAGVR